MLKPLNIAIAGLGIVGAGTLGVLREHKALLEARCGREFNVIAVSARDQSKQRACDTNGIRWVQNPLELAQMADVDVVAELIGGSEGVARALVEAALKAGKHVVTANKALIAHHGMELAKEAEARQVMFAYEAAVAGGIPIIKALREGLVANRFAHVAGILNGTCNFILTSMWEKRQDFPEALAQAQKKGFAEADPTFDIDGIDSAHKLAILTSLAYGTGLAIDAVSTEGIRRITLRDMEFADELGYVIKLLGISSFSDKGVLQRVHPCMIPKISTLGRVNGAYNAVIVEGAPIGRITLEGAGAGAGPTASSVVGDIVDIGRGAYYKPFTIPVSSMQTLRAFPIERLKTCYYVRLAVVDKPGVLASVTAVLRDEGISLRSFLQHSHTPGEPVQVVLTTHETLERAMGKAITAIGGLDFVTEQPHMIRIEPL